jgi:hypothetical protein
LLKNLLTERYTSNYMNGKDSISQNEYFTLAGQLSDILRSHKNNTETVGQILDAINRLNPESFNIIMETKPLVNELLSECVYYFDGVYDNQINNERVEKDKDNAKIMESQYNKISKILNQIIDQP